VFQNLILIAGGQIVFCLGDLSSSSLFAPSWHLNEAFFVFVGFWVSIISFYVEGVVPEEVSMLMTFSASERNVFVVNGLQPVLIMIF
jgi:hypothetical protein